MNLHSEAEALADIIIKLSRKSPKNKKLLKLPPVFTAINHPKYGYGRNNLIAIIRCSADYEDNSKSHKLNEMIGKYNTYGGMPKLASNDLRKVHNWLQLINFMLRVAVMEKLEESETDSKIIIEKVVATLFSSSRRPFVAHPEGHKYELKPLKYADVKTITKWLTTEYENKKAGLIPFAYSPSRREWELYGLRGQTKTAYGSLMKDIQDLVVKARNLDEDGDHQQADMIYERLVSMQKNLEQLNMMLVD